MKTAIPLETELMTDEELCDLLRISKRTLRLHLEQGPLRKQYTKTGYIRLIRKVNIGKYRRWNRASVREFIDG